MAVKQLFMTTLGNLTVLQLQRALEIKQRIQTLENELQRLEGSKSRRGSARWGISAAGRRRIAQAQRARWAKLNTNRSMKGRRKRRMSASARARIGAAQRRRWAAAKAPK